MVWSGMVLVVVVAVAVIVVVIVVMLVVVLVLVLVFVRYAFNDTVVVNNDMVWSGMVLVVVVVVAVIVVVIVVVVMLVVVLVLVLVLVRYAFNNTVVVNNGMVWYGMVRHGTCRGRSSGRDRCCHRGRVGGRVSARAGAHVICC